jgi:hypothetical protein
MLKRLPTDLIEYTAGWLGPSEVCSLAAAFRGSNDVLRTDFIWKPLYNRHCCGPQITSHSRHRGLIKREWCGSDTVCTRLRHWTKLNYRSPAYTGILATQDYKQAFARFQQTRELDDLHLYGSQNLEYLIDEQLQDISERLDRITALQVANQTSQRKVERIKRLRFVQEARSDLLYAFAHGKQQRRRSKSSSDHHWKDDISRNASRKPIASS